jgi:hypothetical protein
MNRKASDFRRAAAQERHSSVLAQSLRQAQSATPAAPHSPATSRAIRNHRSRRDGSWTNESRRAFARRERCIWGGKTEEKRKVTSLTLGTGGKRLWLLRSRPDQVDRPSMRGGPSRSILTSVAPQCDCCSAKNLGEPRGAYRSPPSCNGRRRLQIACRSAHNSAARRFKMTCMAACMPRRMWTSGR